MPGVQDAIERAIRDDFTSTGDKAVTLVTANIKQLSATIARAVLLSGHHTSDETGEHVVARVSSHGSDCERCNFVKQAVRSGTIASAMQNGEICAGTPGHGEESSA